MLVPVKRTPVAEPYNHDAIIAALWRIVRRAAPDLSPELRVRLVAQSIEATGWRQSVENHNLHAVRANPAWREVAGHDWYTLGTLEDDGTGNLVTDSTALWRAYGSPEESTRDALALMRGSRYGSAWSLPADDYQGWWARMGELGWYTATGPEPAARVAGVARRVRATVDRLQLEAEPLAGEGGAVRDLVILAALAALGALVFLIALSAE